MLGGSGTDLLVQVERLEEKQRRYEKRGSSLFGRMLKILSEGKLGVAIPWVAVGFLLLGIALIIFGPGGVISVAASGTATVLYLVIILSSYETLSSHDSVRRSRVFTEYQGTLSAIADYRDSRDSDDQSFRNMELRLELLMVGLSLTVPPSEKSRIRGISADEVWFVVELCRAYVSYVEEVGEDEYIEEGVVLLLSASLEHFRKEEGGDEDSESSAQRGGALLCALRRYGAALLAEAQRQYLYAAEDKGRIAASSEDDSLRSRLSSGVESLTELCVQLESASREDGFDELPAEVAFPLAAARDTTGRIRGGQC